MEKNNKKSLVRKVINNNVSTKELGKGLSLVFGTELVNAIDELENSTFNELKKQGVEVTNLDLDLLKSNPFQPRQFFDKKQLEDLASSIKINGVFTPVLVKKISGNKYYIIAGERRVRASLLADKKTIPAIVTELDDQAMQAITLIENMQREQLNPVEEAYAISHLMELQNLTQAQVSKIIGKSRSYVANTIRILGADQKLIDAVLAGDVSYGHVRPLIGLDLSYIKEMLLKIQDENLSVREVENFTRAYKLRLAKANKKPIKIIKNKKFSYIEDLLKKKFKTKIEITNNRIIIKYHGKQQLNKILELLDDSKK